jgi:outer membrane protein TolC
MSALVVALLLAAPQDPGYARPVPPPAGPLFGSVAEGAVTQEVLPLSLADVVDRGLRRNLRLLLAEQAVRSAEGERWEALSDLLPHVSGRLAATRQRISLEAFGFTGFPGLPTLVGPFNVFDARVALTESALDFQALHKDRQRREEREAARHSYKDARDLVVLACGNLYFQVLAEQGRINAAKAQLETARALSDLAEDRKKAGLVPAVDLLRAQVEAKAREQELIVAENRLARARLTLARTIGLPLGQEFRLTDRISEAQPSTLGVEEALATAYGNREDWQAAQAQVRAAEAARGAARGEGWPSLEVGADYGVIGQTVGGARPTYALGAALKVPLFEGGKVHGKVLKADAELEAKRAGLEDFRGRIDYEVRTALLDIEAARQRVAVAASALQVAKEQLRQAQDRFEAGVANNIDVVQAQEALAAATESYISSLFDQSVSRAQMARALGMAESAYRELVRGE